MDLKKELGGVADAVTKIMMDEKALHPNQQKLDVHEPEKDELTADDFKKLRAGKKAPPWSAPRPPRYCRKSAPRATCHRRSHP